MSQNGGIDAPIFCRLSTNDMALSAVVEKLYQYSWLGDQVEGPDLCWTIVMHYQQYPNGQVGATRRKGLHIMIVGSGKGTTLLLELLGIP